MSASSSPVAFSLVQPLRASFGLDGRPRVVLWTMLVLLWPLPFLVAGVGTLVAGAAGAPLQIALAGFPPASQVLVEPPTPDEWQAFGALVALTVTSAAVLLAAGAIATAVGRTEQRPAAMLRRATRCWPAIVAALAVQLFALCAALSVIAVIAALAGTVRFQLQTVVLVLGIGAASIVTVRTSLWPAVAVVDRVSPFAAMRRSWTTSEGSTIRLCAAVLALGCAVGLPALVLQWMIGWALAAAADAGALVLSPMAIDLWARTPWVVAGIAAVLLWGAEAPRLAEALARWPREDEDAEPAAS